MAKLYGNLKWKRYSKKLPGKERAQYFVKSQPQGTMEFEDFISHMAQHNSPYSRGVIQGVVTDMLDCLQELILQGKTVRVGELGLFSCSINSKGTDTADEANADSITGVSLLVRNTKTWSNRELRKSVRFTEADRYDGMEEGKTEEEGSSRGPGSTEENGGESRENP